MAQQFVNINTDKLVKFTNKLEKMHRSDLPVAIRSTLNKAAFDMKTKTLPASALATFEKRHVGQFYKANSRFEGARGFDTNSMKSTVGFVENRLKGRTNYSVQDLEQQETGGSLSPARSFLPLKGARVGGKGRVRDENRLSEIPPFDDVLRLICCCKHLLLNQTPYGKTLQVALNYHA